MDLLPPVGWADVATRRDLDHVEATLGARIDQLEAATTAGFAAVAQRLDQQDQRFDQQDQRFDQQDQRFDQQDQRIARGFAGIDEHLDERLGHQEERFTAALDRIDERLDHLASVTRLEIQAAQAAILHQLDSHRLDNALKVILALTAVLLSALVVISQLT